MARGALSLLVLCCVAALAAAEGPAPVTYERLKPTRRQWNISIATTKGENKTVFEPVTDCNTTALAAGCLSPALTADHKDKVKFTFTLPAPQQLKTADDLPVKAFVFAACYAKPFTVDRPWRKPNPVVTLDKSCPFILQKTEPNANGSYVITWPVPKNATKAAWYAQVYTVCQNGSASTYCGVDSTVNATYFATAIIESRPVGMQIATAVCAALGPLFLAGCLMKDFVAGKRSK